MRKHFGRRSSVRSGETGTRGMEGVDDGKRYKAVKEEKWWEKKLAAIQEGDELFGEVFCSREEGLVCLDRSCVECGDEGVKRNADIRKACHPEKA
jgi:hypothetical protein